MRRPTACHLHEQHKLCKLGYNHWQSYILTYDLSRHILNISGRGLSFVGGRYCMDEKDGNSCQGVASLHGLGAHGFRAEETGPKGRCPGQKQAVQGPQMDHCIVVHVYLLHTSLLTSSIIHTPYILSLKFFSLFFISTRTTDLH